MFEFLSYDFMVKALVLALLLSGTSALLSPFLVLNKQAMIADGLSHVAFTGVIIGLLLSNEPLIIAIPFSVIASILITFLGKQKMISKDSAIGVVQTSTLALGLVIVSVSNGFNSDIESLLTGMILAANTKDIILAAVILLITLVFIVISYRDLLVVTYDPLYAKFKKINTNLLTYLLAILTSLFIVIGIRSVGMLLISTLIIFPSLIGSQIAKSFKDTIIVGFIVALIVAFLGVWFSYLLDTPTGSTIVLTYAIVLVISMMYRKVRAHSS